MIPLTRDLIARVALQEAAAAGTTPRLVLGMSTEGHAVRARRNAFARLSRETGASAHEIAKLWGCDASSVAKHLRVVATPKPVPAWPAIRPPRPAVRSSEGDATLAAALTTFAAIDRRRGLA